TAVSLDEVITFLNAFTDAAFLSAFARRKLTSHLELCLNNSPSASVETGSMIYLPLTVDYLAGTDIVISCWH
ncbi:MAG: hypothetical protein P8098_13405, partial [Candidatus Thiodiazotropha sp.]